MGVMNIMERIVTDYLESQWSQLSMPCSCEVCKDDVLAFTLNRLPARYASNEKGRMMVRALMMDEQYIADIIREITRAAHIVATNPHISLPNEHESNKKKNNNTTELDIDVSLDNS